MRTRLGTALLAASVLLISALPALAQPAPFGGRPYGPPRWEAHPGALWLFAGFGLLRGLLILGLLILVWRFALSQPFWTRRDGARQILREGYARGEINEEEYHKRLTVLS